MEQTVRPGQVWASNDARDIKAGVRQHRVVNHVHGGYAFLDTPESRYKGYHGVKVRSGRVYRHRLVRNA